MGPGLRRRGGHGRPRPLGLHRLRQGPAGVPRRDSRAQSGGLDSADGALDIRDRFRDDPAAPEWIRQWPGPFTIRIARRPERPAQDAALTPPVPVIDVSCVVPVIDRDRFPADALAARLEKLGETAAAGTARAIARREAAGTARARGELAAACERQSARLGLGDLGLDDALDARDFLIRIEDPPGR